jgi:aminoglycoside 2'-N-acetyltransferase I
MLDEAFDSFDDDDWDHALGGMHVLVHEGQQIVGHASVVMRQLVYRGRSLRCGYFEAMAVAASHRRQGIGTLIMHEVGIIVSRGYELGALSASDDGRPLYAAHGWVPWRGPTFALTPDGTVRTPDSETSVMVLPLPVAPVDADEHLTCDFRNGSLW